MGASSDQFAFYEASLNSLTACTLSSAILHTGALDNAPPCLLPRLVGRLALQHRVDSHRAVRDLGLCSRRVPPASHENHNVCYHTHSDVRRAGVSGSMVDLGKTAWLCRHAANHILPVRASSIAGSASYHTRGRHGATGSSILKGAVPH